MIERELNAKSAFVMSDSPAMASKVQQEVRSGH